MIEIEFNKNETKAEEKLVF